MQRGSSLRSLALLLACCAAAAAAAAPRALPALLLAAGAAPRLGARAAVVEGTLDTLDSWAFIGRFCFVPTTDEQADADEYKGKLRLQTWFDEALADALTLQIFYDDFDNWQAVYRSGKSCEERRQVAASEFHLNAEALLQRDGVNSSDASTWFRAGEPTWFFAVLANCELSYRCERPPFCDAPLQGVEYSLQMTNGDDWWEEQFSADEMGLLETDVFVFTWLSLLLLAAVWIRHHLVRARKLHHTVKLLFFSIALEFFSVFFDIVHWARYGDDGVGTPRLRSLGMTLQGFSELAFLLLLVLVAKGWTIVRRKLSAGSRVNIAIFTVTYFVVFVSCMIYRDLDFDPADVLYLYDSPAGTLLILLRVFGACWFCVAGIKTMQSYRRKVRFYYKFLLSMPLWIMALPLAVLFSFAAPSYRRQAVVHGMTHLALVVAQTILLFMYNPSARCNRSFPFHARATAMEGPNPTDAPAAAAGGGGGVGSAAWLRSRAAQVSSKIRTLHQLAGSLVDVTASGDPEYERVDDDEDEPYRGAWMLPQSAASSEQGRAQLGRQRAARMAQDSRNTFQSPDGRERRRPPGAGAGGVQMTTPPPSARDAASSADRRGSADLDRDARARRRDEEVRRRAAEERRRLEAGGNLAARPRGRASESPRGRDDSGRRDDSPPRARGRDDSPPRGRRDDSPPRGRGRDDSPPRGRGRDDSPPRGRGRASDESPRRDRDDSPPRGRRDDSPPRRDRADSPQDDPPPRRSDDPGTPPRRRRRRRSEEDSGRADYDGSRSRSDDDAAGPARSRQQPPPPSTAPPQHLPRRQSREALRPRLP